jgi:hypothetical protein
MSKPLKTLKEQMLFTKDLGKNWQQVSGSYLDGFFAINLSTTIVIDQNIILSYSCENHSYES